MVNFVLKTTQCIRRHFIKLSSITAFIKYRTFYQSSRVKDEVIFLNVMKVYGSAKVQRHSFLTSKLKVGSQLHAPAAVPPVKESSGPTEFIFIFGGRQQPLRMHLSLGLIVLPHWIGDKVGSKAGLGVLEKTSTNSIWNQTMASRLSSP
jgi:hypothetical protein